MSGGPPAPNLVPPRAGLATPPVRPGGERPAPAPRTAGPVATGPEPGVTAPVASPAENHLTEEQERAGEARPAEDDAGNGGGPPPPSSSPGRRTGGSAPEPAGMRARLAEWRRTWTWLRTAKVASATCAVVVVLASGLAWGAASWVEAAIRQIGALDEGSAAIQDAEAQKGDQNFLVVGSDTRVGATPTEEVGDASDIPGARSDTVMVVHIPEDHSRVTIVSFPRDLEITRPECERWDPVSGQYNADQTVPRTPRMKLNTAYQAGGPRCVTKAVQELSGLAINHFLGVDFQGFQGMVDAVGGVSICVERPIRDGILGDVIDRAGTTTLSGQQALNFVRARHVVGDPTSDYGRIQRQQRFLSSLLRASLSAGTLLDPGKLGRLVDAIGASTFGENVAGDQLVSLGQSLGSLDPRTVTFTTVPTTGTPNGRGNEVLRPSDDRALFASIIQNRPLPGAGPAPAGPPLPPPAPARADVRIVDARDDSADSDVSASDLEDKLRRFGFGVATDDAGAPAGSNRDEAGTSIGFSPDRAAAAATLARSVPNATLEPEAAGAGVLTLTLGDDFDGRVVDPAATLPPPRPVVPTVNAADARCQ